MTSTLQNVVAGLLEQDKRLENWWRTAEPLPVPFFSQKLLPVLFTDFAADNTAEWQVASEALRRFQLLGSAERLAATALVRANYQQMLDACDLEPLDVAEPADIWRFVQPQEVRVGRGAEEFEGGDMYVAVDCECDWEEEHGLQLVFRQGRMLTRVSDQDGHFTESHAYARPEEQDPLMMNYYATFGY